MTKREQSLLRLSEEVVDWGQSNAVQSDWCWSQCELWVVSSGGGGGGGQSSVVRGVREGRGGMIVYVTNNKEPWTLKTSSRRKKFKYNELPISFKHCSLELQFGKKTTMIL